MERSVKPAPQNSVAHSIPIENIRNFSIIAHIDHGKSTLSDRILEAVNAISPRSKDTSQVLDSLEIEKERGITIKSAAITLIYTAKNGEDYLFNLIDTPGHVDFSYEVRRSLASCEGALLIVDASQGVQAQTLSNFYLALEAELELIPVINKIDLPSAEPQRVCNEMIEEFAFQEEQVILVSAKNGINIDEVLAAVVERIPSPRPLPKLPITSPPLLRALIFDSFYDTYRGVIVCVRIFSGELAKGKRVRMAIKGAEYVVEEVGWLGIKRQERSILKQGEVGYVILSLRSVREIHMGDTIALANEKNPVALPGYREVKPMVFAGIFPLVNDKFNELQTNIEKLSLNDAALTFQADNSLALGFGFRCGFLGLLHMEIVQERLSREFNTEVIITAPSVSYKIIMKHQTNTLIVDNPAHFPSSGEITSIQEPFIRATLIFPSEYLGAILQLIRDRRGVQASLHYVSPKRIEAAFFIPLGEFIFDFHDHLKSITRGYGSLDYDFEDYRPADIIKVDILVNKEVVDALSFMAHRSKARARAKMILVKLRVEIPRQMFNIPLQAAVGSNILAREDISALRKDVTAKCYGGDITRKRKLLEKQKEGKKKMKAIGSVAIPQKAFLSVLKTS